MNKWQDCVRDFHFKVVGGPTSPAKPELRDAELRARLIAEEAVETIVALVGGERAHNIVSELSIAKAFGNAAEPDIVETVDGLCDLIYVVLGTAEAIGIDLEPAFQAVHDANMAKVNEAVNAHGKRGGKPPGWVAPNERIAAIIAAASVS